MRPLTMTDSEIRMRYRDGASAQILADLNACGWDRIKKIVGEPIEVKGKVHHGHIDEKRARDLHAEGKTDKEMSIELKVSRGAVALWRSRRGFEANKKEEIMIKETEPTEQDKPTETEMFFADVAPEPLNIVERLCPFVDEPNTTAFPNDVPYDIPLATRDEHEPKQYAKPPIGLLPRKIWDEMRRDAVCDAITRYVSDTLPIPSEWLEEYNERVTS